MRSALLLVALVALVATAGCLDGGEAGGEHGDPVDSVPENQDMLVHVDMALMSDDTTRHVADELAESETNEEDFQAAVEEFENETGLDPTGVDELLMYGTSPQMTASVDADAQEEFGFVLHSSWSEDELVSALNEEEDGELVATSYQGEDVLYEPTGSMAEGEDALFLGVIDDGGAFVLGTEGAVKDALDVEYGDASSLSGPLRDTYDDSRDGLVTFAMVMPEEDVGAGNPTMNDEAIQSIETMSAVYYTEGNDVGLESRISATDGDSAEELVRMVDGALALFASGDSPYGDVLNEVEVNQDGSAVLVTYQQDADELVEALQSIEDQQSQTTL